MAVCSCVCECTGSTGQMLGKHWSVNVLSLAKGVIAGAAIERQRAGQKQHEVQQQPCSFSLPKGDPQKPPGSLCKEQRTSGVLVSVSSTQHELEPPRKRALHLRKDLHQIGL